MASLGGMTKQLERVRAELAAGRARLDRTLDDYRTWTRSAADRLRAAEQDTQRSRQNREHQDAGDYDLVDSWMADPRGGAQPPTDAVVADRVAEFRRRWEARS